MYKCPIDYYMDNIIFNADKSCWAAFKIQGYDYDFLSDDKKISLLHKMTRYLSGILSDAQILILPIEQDIKAHFNRLKGELKQEDVLYYAAKGQAEQTEEYLKQSLAQKGAVNDYRSYIIIKLEERVDSEVIRSLQDGYQYFIKDPVNAINVWMNLDTKDILSSKVRLHRKLADKWFFEQNKRIRMSPVESEEMQWLLRRTAFRGMNMPVPLFYRNVQKEAWEPAAKTVKVNSAEEIIKPFKKDIVNLFSGAIRTKNRTVLVEHNRNVSYQTYLVITNIPDEIDYPGFEWLYMLQQYNLQAEVCIQIKALDYRESLKKLDLKKREINSQMEHIREADADLPEDLQEGKEYADVMEQELKNERYSIMNTCISICLAADNPEELERKAAMVKGEFEDMNFIVERPIADQLKLFMQHIPSVGCITKEFTMPITPIMLASGTIGATHELGDTIGPYIGTTGVEKKHVFLSMGLACLQNKSAAATFFGNLGVGKSFNANLLLYLNVLYGGYGLIFDPKGERSHWETELKVFEGLITTVSLSSDPQYRGKMDPYIIYSDDINLANELALNIISELFKIIPTSYEYTALLEATKTITEEVNRMEGYRPSMMQLAEILDHFEPSDKLYENAKMLARRLRLQKQAGMSQLIFGEGGEAAISLENRLNILQIQNLKMPSPEAKKEDYTSEETLSMVLMMVMSHFAKRFALVKRPVFKIILFDESWALGKTTEGVKLYDYLSRMGRSLYTGCIFNGHSVLDIPSEGIKNTITYKFCFQTTNEAEADRMCSYLGLESTQDNRESLKNLRNGECLFQDLNGRVGILKFDAVFQDIIDVFSTTPTTTDEEGEELQEYEMEEGETKLDTGQNEEEPEPYLEEMEELEDFDIYQMEEEEEEQKPQLDSNIYHKSNYDMEIKTGSLPLIESLDTVVKKEISAANKVLVGFLGTEEKIGVTHNMLLCANFLKEFGYRVALVECNSNQDKYFKKLQSMDREQKESEKFILHGLDCYAEYDLAEIHHVFAENYNFILLDLGEFRPEIVKEFSRCALQIVVGGSKPWQLEGMNQIFGSFEESVLKQMYYLFNLTDKSLYPSLKRNMGELDRVVIADAIADPFSGCEELSYPGLIFHEYIGSGQEEEEEEVGKGLLGRLFKKIG